MVNRKSYDSDSGLSEDNDSKTLSACKTELDRDGPASDALEESFQDETDQESTAVENTKSLSDCELSANVSGKFVSWTSKWSEMKDENWKVDIVKVLFNKTIFYLRQKNLLNLLVMNVQRHHSFTRTPSKSTTWSLHLRWAFT